MRNAVIRGKLKVVRARETDCHTSGIGHWCGNDTGTRSATVIGRADAHIGPYGYFSIF